LGCLGTAGTGAGAAGLVYVWSVRVHTPSCQEPLDALWHDFLHAAFSSPLSLHLFLLMHFFLENCLHNLPGSMDPGVKAVHSVPDQDFLASILHALLHISFIAPVFSVHPRSCLHALFHLFLHFFCLGKRE
jgi:hypothetical protein